ncbi:SRPBCC family protein [Ekhidna sp.]
MPKMTISRSITIDASKEKVFSFINDFNQWVQWSPWLLMEPEANVIVADDAKSYEWKGNRVGEGNMKILEEKENEFIRCELNFLKPWKSFAKTAFNIEEAKDGTEVTWTMDSSLPFFMFWMKKSMQAYVGADYERGLDMLKVLIEKGSIPSKLSFDGISSFEGCKWVGIRTKSSLDIVATQMQADFAMLGAFTEENKDLVAGSPFTTYHKWDILKGNVDYTASIPVKEIPDSLPDQFVSGIIPSLIAYKLKHTGSYSHLGNAWSTGYAMMRNKEFKYKKGIDTFEIYLNNPQETNEKNLETVLHFPVR